MDCVLCAERKAYIYIYNLNKPALHSICVFDRPTEDAEFLRKFRIAMHAFHAALSKSTSKFFLPERSLPEFVQMSKSIEMLK
jgi:hypothetical protein